MYISQHRNLNTRLIFNKIFCRTDKRRIRNETVENRGGLEEKVGREENGGVEKRRGVYSREGEAEKRRGVKERRGGVE